MNATVLKHVLEGDFSSFKEELSKEVDSKIKNRLTSIKEKFPKFLASELEMAEAKEEDEDEDLEDEDEDEDGKKKKKGKKDDEDEDEDGDEEGNDKMAKVRAAKGK